MAAELRMASLVLGAGDEGRDASDGLAEDECVDVVRALIRVDGLEVGRMAHDCKHRGQGRSDRAEGTAGGSTARRAQQLGFWRAFGHAARTVVLILDAVAAEHVAARTRDLERLAARVALDERDHLGRKVVALLGAADGERGLEAEADLGDRVGQLLLDELLPGKRTPSL